MEKWESRRSCVLTFIFAHIFFFTMHTKVVDTVLKATILLLLRIILRNSLNRRLNQLEKKAFQFHSESDFFRFRFDYCSFAQCSAVQYRLP